MIRDAAKGLKVVKVETAEDDIVYNGVSHIEFVSGPLVIR